MWVSPHFLKFTVSFSGFEPFFRNKFPGLFQDSDRFFQDSQARILPSQWLHQQWLCSLNKLHMLCHMQLRRWKSYWQSNKPWLNRNPKITLHTTVDLKDFPGLVVIFQDFPVLENAKLKFQDFPGFPGPVRTLYFVGSVGQFSQVFDPRPLSNVEHCYGYSSCTVHCTATIY